MSKLFVITWASTVLTLVQDFRFNGRSAGTSSSTAGGCAAESAAPRKERLAEAPCQAVRMETVLTEACS